MRRIVLNQNWRFQKCDGSPAVTVDLPHTWYREEDPYRGESVYQKTVEAPDCGCLFLEIGAADHTVTAYGNGEKIGTHQGGYSRVRFGIPEHIIKDGKLELELHVDNRAGTSISPLAGDFTVFGGLTRDVALLTCEKYHFDYLYYGTDGLIVRTSVAEDGSGILEAEPHVRKGLSDPVPPDAKITYYLTDPSGNLEIEACERADTPWRAKIPSPCLWNGKGEGALYTLRAELSLHEKILDVVEIKTGFRTFSLDPDKGFFLNGRRLRLNGVAMHQDFAGCYSAVTQKEIDRNFELISEIGANALRLSHYQHPPYTYDRCDAEGYVVWSEIPMLKMTQDPAVLENAKSQLTELILQNIHHPSVFFWGVQNEIGMFRDAPPIHAAVRELTALCQKLDPGRLVTCANLNTVKSSSVLNHLTPMVGYNLYFGWYYGKMEDYREFLDRLHKDLPDTSLGISEYGVDAAPFLHAREPLVKDYSEEFQALWHETVYPILQSKDYLWGSFVWNMFDFSSSRREEGGQKYINAKGLITYDRTVKKDAFYYYKAKWSDVPFLKIREKRFVHRCAKEVTIKVYTNLPEAVLCLPDGATVTRQNNGNGGIVFPPAPLCLGENSFTVTAEEDGVSYTDSVTFQRVEEPDESYALPDSGAGETVDNWFLGEEDLDADSYYSLLDTAQDLMDCQETWRILNQYVPDLCRELEKGTDIPLGLSMRSILAHDGMEEDRQKAINLAIRKVEK